jgi:hypothetical protein
MSSLSPEAYAVIAGQAASLIAEWGATRSGAGTRSRGSDDSLWAQRRLLRRGAFGLCGRTTAAAARGRALFRQPWLRRSLRLRPLLLSKASEKCARIFAWSRLRLRRAQTRRVVANPGRRFSRPRRSGRLMASAAWSRRRQLVRELRPLAFHDRTHLIGDDRDLAASGKQKRTWNCFNSWSRRIGYCVPGGRHQTRGSHGWQRELDVCGKSRSFMCVCRDLELAAGHA